MIILFSIQFREIQYLVFSLIENPHIPMFVLHELNRNPEIILNFMKSQGLRLDLFFETINDEIKKGTGKGSIDRLFTVLYPAARTCVYQRIFTP